MTTSAGTKVVPEMATNAWLKRVAVLARVWPADDEDNVPSGILHAIEKYHRAMLAAARSAPVQAWELVKRLRKRAEPPSYVDEMGEDDLLLEAAAEIERLSAAATVGPISDEQITQISWDAEKSCSGHARCDDFERAIKKSLKLATDEKGRPITYWGGMAEKVDAGSAEPVAWYVKDYGITWRDGCQPPIPFPSIHKPTPANPEPPRVTMRLYTRLPAPKTAWIDATTVERNSRQPAPKASDSAHGAKHIARLQRRADALQTRLDASPQQADFADERAELKSLQWAIEALELAGRK